MAEPSTWGDIVGSYGRIGISTVVTKNTDTTYKFYYEVWIWTKYGLSDSSNTLYANCYSSTGSANTSLGSKSISTTVSSGSGWSDSNKKKIYTSDTFTVNKKTSSVKRYIYAKLTGIERVGGTMYASKTITIGAKTSYTVSYNANNGSGAPSSQTKWHDADTKLSSVVPERTGYTFKGWGTSSSDTTVDYAPGATYSANKSITLYAIWQIKTYTITLNANGGTNGTITSITKNHGSDVSLPNASQSPTMTNYTFLGWSTSKSATTATYAPGVTYTKNENVTLYAVWARSYTKPKISSLSIKRCDSSGNASDNGTYALVKFNWSCQSALSSIKIEWKLETATTYTGSKDATPSDTSLKSGTVSQIVGDGNLSIEESYSFLVTVHDFIDSSDRPGSISGQKYYIDFLDDDFGTAIGKPAELAEVFDVGWLTMMRKHLCVGDKTGHLDGKQGIFLSNEGYIHLQRTTAQMYNPYIAFLTDDETSVTTQIRHNVSTDALEFLGADSYLFDNTLLIGSQYGEYKPYYSAGDVIDVYIATSGFVTNSKKDVFFTMPLSKPIIGNPSITAASGDGFKFRQGSVYTHGSSASVFANPASYKATQKGDGNHIIIKASFTNVTNAVNNESIGIAWYGTITFS